MKEITEMKIETMSSREIAELTGKKHNNVIRDLENMLKLLNLEQNSFLSFVNDGPNGKKLKIYNLPKDLTITLVSGYNTQMRYAIIKRWEQLEEVVKDLDVISKVKAIALTGDFNAATKAVSDLCNDSEQIGKVGSKLMTERKRQKREAKKLIKEVNARFQLDLF